MSKGLWQRWKEDAKAKLEEWRSLIELFMVLAAFATLTSLVLAIKQGDQLEGIADRVSTRYVGTFPDNIPDITELIREAEDEVFVLCDVAGYGAYSGAAAFTEYRDALLAAARRGVDVHMYVYDEAYAKKAEEEQFAEALCGAADSDSVTEAIMESEAWKPFFDHHRQAVEPKTIGQWKTMLAQIEKKAKTDLGESIIVNATVRQNLPKHVWLIDQKRGVFSFVDSFRSREVAFATHDSALIDVLKKDRDVYVTGQGAVEPLCATSSSTVARR